MTTCVHAIPLDKSCGDCTRISGGVELARCMRMPPSLANTLRARSKYGPYSEMAELAQRLKRLMQDGATWGRLSYAEQESLDVIATKIARIVTGDPRQEDSWHDIGGYARLAEVDVREASPRVPVGAADRDERMSGAHGSAAGPGGHRTIGS